LAAATAAVAMPALEVPKVMVRLDPLMVSVESTADPARPKVFIAVT
jgi:hypothetical protein